jgi:hypothetical protein
LTNIGDLRQQLKKFRDNRSPEYELAPIEKWMINELNVARLDNPGGSRILYFHKALSGPPNNGRFGIDKVHGKKVELIRRFDFRKYLYRPLCIIIESIEMEQGDGEETS